MSTCSVAFGAYSHGNHYGVIRRTFQFWYVCKYFNAFMRFHGAKGQWSSIQLGYDCHVGPHKDAHNLHSSVNWAISFGDFTNGRLWLERNSQTKAGNDNEITEAILSDGTRAQGYLLDTRRRMTSFSPKTQHGVEQWTGVRCSIVAYTTRRLGEMTRPERDVLRSNGFPLGRSEGSADWEKEHRVRPKKSIRRSLWKGAQRASAMIALSMTAASSYIAECIAHGKSPDQVSLLEVGGVELTCETIEAGFRTIEPLSWNDYLEPQRGLDVHDTLSKLKPQVLWFQGNAVESAFEVTEQIVATADLQLGLGGDFVYQANVCDPFWEHPKLKGLLREQPHSYQASGDDRILRVGGQCDRFREEQREGSDGDKEELVASHSSDGKHEGDQGASAIHFDKSVPKHVQSALARLHQNSED